MRITGVCTVELQEKIIVIPMIQSFFVTPSYDIHMLVISLFGGKDIYLEYVHREDAYRDKEILAECVELYYKEVLDYAKQAG